MASSSDARPGKGRGAATTKRNMFSPDPLQFYNAGLSYFWSGNGNTTVFFDTPRLTG